MCTQWIDYKGEKILYQDFSKYRLLLNSGPEKDFIEIKEIVLTQPLDSVRVLADFRYAHIGQQLMEAIINSSNLTKSHTRKVAALGVSGPKRIMADMIVRLSGQPITFFEDPETAQEWLIA
jgi:hypothetical protein